MASVRKDRLKPTGRFDIVGLLFSNEQIDMLWLLLGISESDTYMFIK